MPSDRGGELAELVDAVTRLEVRLDDLALAVLREAADEGATSRPELERRLTRARHALGRCRSILLGGTRGREEDVP